MTRAQRIALAVWRRRNRPTHLASVQACRVVQSDVAISGEMLRRVRAGDDLMAALQAEANRATGEYVKEMARRYVPSWTDRAIPCS